MSQEKGLLHFVLNRHDKFPVKKFAVRPYTIPANQTIFDVYLHVQVHLNKLECRGKVNLFQ